MPRNAPASASAAERPHAAPTVAAFCWPVPVAVADVEVEVRDGAVELFPDEDTEEDEDEKGAEDAGSVRGEEGASARQESKDCAGLDARVDGGDAASAWPGSGGA